MTTSDPIINISRENISGNCDFKCSYSYNYVENNLVAKNNGNMIVLTNSGIQPDVTYNNNQYMVSSVIITSPSLHKFNNSKTDGEVLIEHVPTNGGNHLFVCIPLIKSSNLSNASVLVSSIIEYVSVHTPSQGKTINLDVANFNLNAIIPNDKPFYSYIGPDMNGYTSDFVVFDLNTAIPLNDNTFNTLTKIITPFSIQMRGTKLFYNKKGTGNIEAINTPGSTQNNDSDTSNNDSDTNNQNTPSSKNNFNFFNINDFDLYSFVNSDIFINIIKIIINFVFLLGLLFIINYLLTYITNSKSKNKLMTPINIFKS